jgi:dTDP-4-amino-4,6-dideoxygalactose transaminase
MLSFYPTKVMNGIDGGAVLTDDPAVHSAVARTVSYADQVVPDGSVRYNLRMNNLNAAFALGTMRHLDTLERGLREAFARLSSAARDAGLRTLDYRVDVPTKFVVATPDGAARDAWVDHLIAHGIEAAPELIPVCPAELAGHFPAMQRLVSTTFSLPFHPALTDHELDCVEKALGRGP